MAVFADSACAVVVGNGLSQEELDQLCTTGDSGCEEDSRSPKTYETADGDTDQMEELVSKDLYRARRRKRITFMMEPLPQCNPADLDLRGGLTQAALDRLLVGEEDVRGEDFHAHETEELLSSDLYIARRRKRISAGMQPSNCSPDDLDLRGGLTQAALDRLLVDEEDVPDDDAQAGKTEPESSALYNARRCRRTFSAGEAVAQRLWENESSQCSSEDLDLRGGLTQAALDRLQVGEEEFRDDNGNAQIDTTEAVSSDLYNAKRRKRPLATKMRTEMQLSDFDTFTCNSNDLDPRGGFTQAALDRFIVVNEDSEVDSPISTSLCRLKRSRVSDGGVCLQKMLPAGASQTASARRTAKSPRKVRSRLPEPENMVQRTKSLMKADNIASDNVMFSTPSAKQQDSKPLSPLNA